MSNLKTRLEINLEKALDKTKLVQVQIMVRGKNGKMFPRMQWKNPADVKSTDVVIGNQSVLDDYKKEQAKKQSMQSLAKNNFKQSIFDNLKQDKSKRKEAMDYAKLCGISWNEHSNPNINWMRCCMAVDALNKVSVSTSVVSISTSVSLDLSSIPSNWDSMDKKSKISELLKTNSKKGLMDFAKENGVTWKEDPNSEGINWMRASMAIQKFLDTKSLSDLTSSSQSTTSTKPVDKVEPVKKKPESDKLEIPANATTRERNLIELINKITDEEDIKLFKSTGMIAEDDIAKGFLKTKLLPKYEEWKKGTAAKSNTSGRSRSYASDRYFGKDSADSIGSVFKGIPKKLLAKGIVAMRDNMDIAPMLYPRECISPIDCISQQYRTKTAADLSRKYSVGSVLRDLNSAYSTYSDDSDPSISSEYNYINSSGAHVGDFDENKDGFCTVLEHIKSKSPSLSTECDRMRSKYLEMIKEVGGNYKTLETILNGNDYEDLEGSKKKYERKMKVIPKVVKVFRDLGLTDAEIVETISGSWDAENITLRNADYSAKIDASGNLLPKINLKELVGKDSDGSYLVDSMYSIGQSYSYSKFYLKDGNTGLTDFEQLQYDAIKDLTFEKYKNVHAKSLELFGMKLVKIDSNTGTTTDADLSFLYDSNSAWDVSYYMGDKYNYTPDPNVSDDVDSVIANLLSISSNYKVKSDIQSNASYDCTPSKANENGNNYSENFNWFRSENSDCGKVFRMDSGGKTYTASEVNSIIKSQLESVPVITPEFIGNLRKFVEEKGSESYSAYRNNSTDTQKKLSKAASYGLNSEDNIHMFKGTPIYDLIVEQLKDISNYCPQMKTTRVNTKEKLHKLVSDKLDFTPFDFSTLDANKSASSPSPAQTDTNAEKLKKLRKELFGAVHCSIKTCDSKVNADNETHVKHNWDKGVRGTSGSRLYGHISGVFHGSYEVKNSVQEEKFVENCKKLGETPKIYFHGTNHSGACGIIGVDGRFRAPKDSSDARKQGLKYAGGMLGQGIYLADMAGKSAGYFGDWGNGYNKEGCLLVCDAILGKHYTASNYSGSSAPSSYDSVSMKAGTNTGRLTLRADEWCIRNPDFVFPKYIMDMEVKNR